MLGMGHKRLYNEGALTEGLVVGRSDTADGINYHLTIRVKFPDGTTTQFKKWLDWHDVGQFTVGSVVPVRYDRSDQSKVVLDIPALEHRHAQAAAAGTAALDAQLAGLGEPDAEPESEAGVQALAGLGNLGDLKAQLLRAAAETGASVVNLSSNSSPESAPDPVDRLAKLADLKDRGALTDEEFLAEKAKILGES